MKINFEPIGEALKAFDTDKMDISRRVPIQNPDGTTGETTLDTPLYTNIDCHISFDTVDNPNSANAVDSEPIITVVTINCPLEVDLQKGDYIIAKKLSNAGEVLETYSGIIGNPTVDQARQKVQMEMRVDV